MLSVDIFVTTYNSEKTIKKTLDSILSNDYKNFHIIISDDASKDSTLNILEEYKKIYTNIRVLTTDRNRGILDNCNYLVENLNQSDIVMFCGHDDVFFNNKISECVKIFEKNDNVALVYHDMKVVYPSGKTIKFSETQKPREKNASEYLLYGTFSTAPSVCVKTEFLKKVRFKKEVDRASDYLMMYEIAKLGEIVYIEEVLGEYHRHDNNLSTRIKNSEDFDSISAGIYVLKHYPEDTFGALVLLNRALLKLFLKRRKYLLFYFISPIFTTIWHFLSKLGKKII
jgi:glycosyltransferase involved in cell wall biosynthesis